MDNKLAKAITNYVAELEAEKIQLAKLGGDDAMGAAMSHAIIIDRLKEILTEQS